MARHQVFIVKEGGYAGMSHEKGDYDRFVDHLREALDEAEDFKPGTGAREKEKACDVHVVTSTDEALTRAALVSRSTFVFVTRGMLEKAKAIKKQFGERIRVVVLTGTFPDDEVILLDKRITYKREVLQNAILEW